MTSTLTYKRGSLRRLELRGRIKPELLKVCAGLWNVEVKRKGLLEGPATPRFIELLRELDSEIELGIHLETWYSELRVEEEELIAIKSAAVCTGGWGPYFDKLWPAQKQAVLFLWAGAKGMNCDFAGAGKTAVAIVASSPKKPMRNLIVCPNYLTHWWYDEIKAWTDDVPAMVVESRGRNEALSEFLPIGGYLIVNYEKLRLMPELVYPSWDWVIADESFYVKNPKAQVTRAFHRIWTKHRILLTATPFKSDPAELFSQLKATRPKLYRSYWFFWSMYSKQGLKGRSIGTVGVQRAHLLKRELAPLMIQRLEEDFGIQLPPLRHQKVRIRLLRSQIDAYVKMATEIRVELESGEEFTVLNAISRFTRLRQIVEGLSTLTEKDISAKLDVAVNLFVDRGEPIVFFTAFRNTAFSLQKRLEKKGYKVSLLIGKTSAKHQHEEKRKFQEGETDALVATLTAGGMGHTLTRAATSIFLTLPWTPDDYYQASKRIHRPSQTRPCLILRLHCNHTVDNLLQRINERKLQMTSEVLLVAMRENLDDSLAYL